MEDLKKKLAFPNASIQLQALSRLSLDVRKKKSSEAKIKDDVSQMPEVPLLLECLCSQSPLVANAAGHAVVQLVREDIIDFTFALNSILNFGPSAKVTTGVAEAVGNLLCLQVLATESMGETYKCPYSIRASPHPLISLLANRPDAWLDVTQQMSRIFNHHDKRIQSQSVIILRPFIAFVLLEPQLSDQYRQARDEVRRILVSVCLSGSDLLARDVIDLVLVIFERMQMTRKDTIIKNVAFLENIIKAIHHRLDVGRCDTKLASDTEKFWGDAACRWLKFSLEMCCLCLELNVPFTGLTDGLQLLTKIVELPTDTSDATLCLLSQLLSYPTIYNDPKILELATTIVQSSPSPSSLCLATLVAPLLRILSMTSTLGQEAQSRLLKPVLQATRNLLENIHWRIETGHVVNNQSYDIPSCLSEKGHFSRIVGFVLQDFIYSEISIDNYDNGDGHAKSERFNIGLARWLKNIHNNLVGIDHCTEMLSNLVISVLMTNGDVKVTKVAVQLMVKIATLDPNQAPDFLPVLLHAVHKNPNPEARLVLFKGIPLSATHKFCVPAVLKTIQALGTVPSLHALSIILMVMLWQRHDRTFPHMLRMVSESAPQSLSQSEWDDIMLAKATAIHEMCKLRPEQHGAELLQPLSDILSAASHERNTTVSAITLEGLYLLCQAEVIDIKSLWSVLGDKLMHETRSLVVTKICKLLSLVPILNVETEEYQAFLSETVTNLNLYTLSTDSDVKAAAYQALSQFPQELFKISHFPRDITEEFYEKTEQENSRLEAEEEEVSVDELFPSVPGSLFMSLLQTFDKDKQLQAYEMYLRALTEREVSNLPRGVFYSALRRQGPMGKEGRALKSIPALLLKQWEQCQHPGLRPGVAAGLLFSYDPPLEVARDGRPRKHYIIRHGKAYLQMFNTLLQEVPLQPSDWHQLSLIPQAWLSFLERLFMALLESRKAELDLQEQHSHATASELEEKKTLAWLWVRDHLLDVIKSASKGNPSTQGHCVLALASLARCIHRFAADLDLAELKTSNETSDHRGHAQWMIITLDTIRHFIDSRYYPKEGLHELCQQSSGSKRSPASTICLGMARVAGSMMVPILTQLDTDCIFDFLKRFSSNLPSGSDPLSSPVVTFLNSLALGNLLGRLFEEHFSDMTGSKGMLAVWKSLSALEDVCLSCDEENGPSAMLGLRAAICGLCGEGKTESRVHVKLILDKLIVLWKELDIHHAASQPLTVTVACICASIYSTSLSKDEDVLPVIHNLKEFHEKDPKVTGISLSLGLLVHTMVKNGHRSMLTWQQDLVKTWSQSLLQEETAPLEKVSKLTGLLALIGSEKAYIPSAGDSMKTKCDVDVSDVIATVTEVLTNSSDPGLKNVSAWMLGHVYLSVCDAGGDSRASAPSSYSYLPESSCLRAIVDFLIKAGRLGVESIPAHQVLAAIKCLDVRKLLPPLNWPGLLSPFMRMDFGNEVKTITLKIAANQMSSSTTAAMFLTYWLTPPLFYSLSIETQASMHRHLPDLIRSWSPATLKLYLDRCCKPPFTNDYNKELQLSILHGLRDALALKDPPASVTMLLNEAISELYHCLPDNTDKSLLVALAECLAEVSDDILDSIIVADFADSSTVTKGSFVRCHVVATGNQPLSLLNYMIDASFNTAFWQEGFMPGLLSHCLVRFCRNKHTVSQAERQEWLSEFLGHTRSVVTGALPLADTAPPKQKVIHHVISLVTTILLTLTYPNFIAIDLLGLDLNLFTEQQLNEDDEQNQSDLYNFKHFSQLFGHISKLLPSVLHVLECKQWSTLAPKLIDWLTTLIHLPELSDEDKIVLFDALTAMRHCQEFKQASVWCNAFMLPFR